MKNQHHNYEMFRTCSLLHERQERRPLMRYYPELGLMISSRLACWYSLLVDERRQGDDVSVFMRVCVCAREQCSTHNIEMRVLVARLGAISSHIMMGCADNYDEACRDRATAAHSTLCWFATNLLQPGEKPRSPLSTNKTPLVRSFTHTHAHAARRAPVTQFGWREGVEETVIVRSLRLNMRNL